MNDTVLPEVKVNRTGTGKNVVLPVRSGLNELARPTVVRPVSVLQVLVLVPLSPGLEPNGLCLAPAFLFDVQKALGDAGFHSQPLCAHHAVVPTRVVKV